MRLATLRRGVRRGCLAGAGACLVLAVLTPAADAQDPEPATTRPQVFSGSAAALAASVQLDREGLLPVPDLFRFILADGSGTYQTSEQRGRASLVFPGNGLILGPSLACSQIPADDPVFGAIVQSCLAYSFPLSVTADSLEPDQSTEGSVALGTPADPVSTHGVGARAHAGIDAVTTAAEISDLRMLGAPGLGPLPAVPGFEDLEPTLLSIGSATATTDQRIDEVGALVVDAEAALSDVHLLGGLVRIGSLVSHRTRIVDGEGDPVTEATLEFSGVTVAGTPARISERGLEIGSASAPLGPLLEAASTQLGSVLESVSFRMTPLGVDQGVDDDGISFAGVGGLLVEFSVPVSGLPVVPGPLGDLDLNGDYVGTIVLGAVGSRAVANDFDRLPPVGSASPARPGGTSIGGGVAAGAATGGVLPSPGGAPPAAGPATGADQPSSDPAVQLVADLFADRLRLLYLAFTLAGLAACLAPRLSLPARLPGVEA